MLTWQDPMIQVFMEVAIEMKNPLLLGLSYAKWQTRSRRQWRGCSMTTFLQRVVEVHIVNIKTITVKNLMMKILVLGMVSMTVSEMVVVVVAVVRRHADYDD